MGCGLLELGYLIRINIVLIALGKTVHKEGSSSSTVEDDRTKTTRLALTNPCQPLLDNATTEIGIYLPLFGTLNGGKQDFVGNALLSREALKPCILEYPH